MNRTITLIRHAKSDWSHPELSDFDRPLNGRGRHDAPRMGNVLKERGTTFDLVISSPACRAITTAGKICGEIGYLPENIVQIPDLYLASASEMISIIQSTDDAIKHLALVAHNPGITTLANRLGEMQITNIPTCGITIFETGIDSWSRLESGCCHTVDFLYPKLF
ncbi:MAG: histidine phosphatase family protein [Mariprofundaceae bacterium]|nr:histidine phosphatase family protein [Mariprofundaceae bacterium]